MEPMSPLTKAAATPGSRRRTQVALGVGVALVVGLGYGYSVKPAAASPGTTAAATATPVRNTTVVCPIVTGQNDANFAAFTPGGATAGAGDAATVTAFNSQTPAITLKQTGALTTADNLSGNVPDLEQENVPQVAQATGAYAPGFTVTETITSTGSGTLHGLASTPCTAPDADYWYIGAAADAKSAKLNLYNSDQIAAEVNLAGYTQDGPVPTATMQTYQGLLVQPGAQYTQPVDLTALGTGTSPIAVHVTTTAGRVSAALLDSDSAGGRDFILAQKPAAHLVIPGIPAPTNNPATKMKLQLTLLSPSSDTDVSLHWIGGSTIVPSVTVPHLTAGKVVQTDLSGVPVAGEAAALQIDSTNNTPIIAEIQVVAEGGSDTAYLSPVPALTGEALVADDSNGSVVELTNTAAKDAQVKVTAEGSGTPNSQTVTVPADSTKAVQLQGPAGGGGTFAVSVVPLAGANSIYAARIMTAAGGLLTIQPMSTALETVNVPAVRSDLSGAVPQS
jgi:uncharacterized protein DUF5719